MIAQLREQLDPSLHQQLVDGGHLEEGLSVRRGSSAGAPPWGTVAPAWWVDLDARGGAVAHPRGGAGLPVVQDLVLRRWLIARKWIVADAARDIAVSGGLPATRPRPAPAAPPPLSPGSNTGTCPPRNTGACAVARGVCAPGPHPTRDHPGAAGPQEGVPAGGRAAGRARPRRQPMAGVHGRARMQVRAQAACCRGARRCAVCSRGRDVTVGRRARSPQPPPPLRARAPCVRASTSTAGRSPSCAAVYMCPATLRQ